MTDTFPRPEWLETARFYEVYPQSFADSNGDGIGDIPGITAHLDYIRDLGCNALWINPCFDSPFKDAGYDVRDYLKVAPRYGTNDDLIALFDAAHRRGMHVLLDLVPGHTSEEHRWFDISGRAERNEYSDRYIWTDTWLSDGGGLPFIGGEAPRDGAYIINFFKCQPALNYGFARVDRPWQQTTDSPAAQATRQAMIDVMRFWIGQGCDGFRVDMANSLVKHDDDGKAETIRAWRQMLGTIKSEYPQTAFVSEWGVPDQSLKAGFDMDFYLDWSWERNGYNRLCRDTPAALDAEHDRSYFSARGGGSVHGFLDQYLPQYERTRDKGYFCLLTCNHDTPRLAPRLSERELAVAYAMILTMPGVPFLYYGDEIGMRYRVLPTKEGGYTRTGTRTPMQWGDGANLGFSSADPADLYLPVDPAPDAPTVRSQSERADSLYHWVRAVLALRDAHRALDAGAAFDVVAAPEDGRLFAYLRTAADGGERLLVAVNPGLSAESCTLPDHATSDGAPTMVLTRGDAVLDGESLTLGAQSVAVIAV
ncbi:alpha-amylase family glycosyl hydrolase [Bifidobacterium phasiani]|uniref:alpha-amylase family glycosyl hydrolase n=1 Tax=Bifidobacterium phasiani TaxID=2834431 RepID=UPI001EEC2ABE|nr:alpha-amylase family glycosyl hydrolase [Bifidobacterium phasiani]